MNIKKGDNVIMLAGNDRKKTGKIIAVHNDRIVVEGLNTIKRHQKARKHGQQGQIMTKERLVDRSNVQIICPKCARPTRIARRVENGRTVRVCKRCGSDL